jgi:amino acid permease
MSVKMTPATGAGMMSTIFNLTSTIIGAGMLAIPFAMHNSGYVGGIAIIVLCWMCALLSFYLLARCSDITGLFSYKEIAIEAFGRVGGTVALTSVICYTMCSCINYGVLVADFGTQALSVWIHEDSPVAFVRKREVVIIISAVVFVIPLALQRNLSSLKWASVFAVFCALYVGCLVFGFFVWGHGSHIDPTVVTFKANTAFEAFPTLVQAFTAHYNALRFYKELEDRNIYKYMMIAIPSSLFCFALYTVIGLCGYFYWGSSVNANILVSFDPSDPLIAAADLTMGFVIILSYPLTLHALRDNIEMLLFPPSANLTEKEEATIIRNKKFLTVALVAALCSVAMLVPNIEVVIGFNGSTFGVMVCIASTK